MSALYTNSLSNQNIATTLLVGTYTADADRAVYGRVSLDQVVGTGATYYCWATVQKGGVGSAYLVIPTSVQTLVTATEVMFITTLFPVLSADVVRFYVLGAAADTTTVDTICEVIRDDTLRPATAGRTLEVDASGVANANAVAVSGDATAADNLESQYDGTGYTNAKAPATQETLGTPAGASIAADIASVKTDTGTTIPNRLPAALSVAGNIKADVEEWKAAVAPAMTGDAFARLGAPAGASVSADVASVKADTGTTIPNRLPAALSVAGNMKSDVEEWKAAVAPAMTGDAFARLGAPAGASVSADIASVKTDTGTTIPSRLPAALSVAGNIKSDVEEWKGAAAPAMTGDAFARLGAPVGASISADIASVKADTGTSIPATLGAPAGASVSADIADIKTDTGTDLPATLGAPAGASVSADIAAVKADTGVAIPADIAGLPNDILDSPYAGHATGTVGEALLAARAQAFGKWTKAGDVLTLYGSDGVTVVRTFTLAPSGGPYSSRA